MGISRSLRVGAERGIESHAKCRLMMRITVARRLLLAQHLKIGLETPASM